MSLLNDALRAAEERQSHPEVASAYTGGQASRPRKGRSWIAAGLVLIALCAAAGGGYWISQLDADTPTASTQNDNTIALVTESPDRAADHQGAVQRSEPEQLSVAVPEPSTAEPAQEPEPEPVAVNEPALNTEPAVEAAPVTESEPSVASAQRSEPAQSEPEPALVAESEPGIDRESTSTQTQTQAPTAEQSDPAAAPTVVNRKPKSPQAIDRQIAKELETLINRGQLGAAEAELAELTQEQNAPQSRFVVARALLVEGQADRALRWLPETSIGESAALRMLRARALHAQGQLDQAVATLQTSIPPVTENSEYRVTLATLLQQQGQGQDAARHWAELIAWDDSRAPWWVGLAISLEDQGQIRGATRAYEQAAALPGLSPSLADYVQQRLRSLRAG